MNRPRPRPRLGSGFEALESRDVPTAFGVPWADPGHLTLSFVPDGTPTPNGPSTLFQTMNKVAPTATWEREILRAFQSWASQVNVNVGVVADGGQPLGTLGAVQGDKRFGDIRIAAAPIPGENEVAAASPFSWTGTTFSGDVVFDPTKLFQVGKTGSGYDIYSVAVHEAGHVLGLGHSTATDSVMQETYAYHAGLGASDIAAEKALYGARQADAFDAARANNTMGSASSMPKDPYIPGRLDAAGDLTTAADVDYYKFTVPLLGGLTGISVRLTADGQSLLTPSVTVYNSSGRVVASGQSTDPTNNDIALRFGTSLFGGSYTVKVDGATADFGTGGYQLTVDYLTLGSLLAPVTNLLGGVLDLGTNDLLGLATILSPTPKPVPDARFDYTYRGVIESKSDVDDYKIHAPAATAAGPMNLNVMVWGTDALALNPRLRVFDAAGNPVAFQVLANDTGIFSLQVPNVTPGADYYVQVAARNPGAANSLGSYFLGADFNQLAPTTYDALPGGTLNPGGSTTDTLTVTTGALFQFALGAAVSQSGAGAVTMTVTDATGNVWATETATAGQPTVTDIEYLPAGTYTVRYTYSAVSGATNVGVNYELFLLQLSDPVGPYMSGTTGTGDPSGGGSTTSSGGYTTTSSGGMTTTSDTGYYYTSYSTSSSPGYWYSY